MAQRRSPRARRPARRLLRRRPSGICAALVSLTAEERLAAANVRAAQTSIRAADAQSDRAGADRRRYDSLVASGAVAQRDADTYRAAAITAASAAERSRADLDVSRNQADVTAAKRATLDAGLAQAVAAVSRAQAALDLARQDQGHAVIRAPIDGVVGDRQVEPGDYVQPGTRLMTVVPLNAVYVTANLETTGAFRPRGPALPSAPGGPARRRARSSRGRRGP